MPTAFLATWGTRGPVIGSYAEYDAVPGNSQESVLVKLHAWVFIPMRPATLIRIPCLA